MLSATRETVSVDDLVNGLAWGIMCRERGLLPHAPRKGPIRLRLDDCFAIARRDVEELKAHQGVIEIVVEIAPWHSTRGAAAMPKKGEE